MSLVLDKLYRLSQAQLRALYLLAQSKNGIISSVDSSEEINKKGKALGGVFSSLSRQKIGDDHLVLPWGRPESGRGLRWKLNEKLINRQKLLEIVKKLLAN